MTAPARECQPANPELRQHTPTPWTYDENHPACVYSDDPTGSIVATCEGFRFAPRPAAEQAANAALIVEAVNNYERLKNKVAVLEMVIAEELYPSDCDDAANAMIVEEILGRSRA